jgi:hypothetical protein
LDQSTVIYILIRGGGGWRSMTQLSLYVPSGCLTTLLDTLEVGFRKEPSKIKVMILTKVKIITIFLENSEITNPNFSIDLKTNLYVDSQSQSSFELKT